MRYQNERQKFFINYFKNNVIKAIFLFDIVFNIKFGMKYWRGFTVSKKKDN